MSIKAKPSFSLADQLFNEQSVAKLAIAIKGAMPTFKQKAFQKEVLSQFPALELKARIGCLVDTLAIHLPDDFQSAIKVLEGALPGALDTNKTDDDFGEFIWAAPGEFVAKHGCTQDRHRESLVFLEQATMRFSVEAAIRPFLANFPAETMAFIHRCAEHENYHVRRLASEGIRPYLPWALRVRLPIPDVLAVLTKLHADPTRYVTRSVANTLNDLSKDDSEIVVATLKRWKKGGAQQSTEIDWMIRHALRTLSKTDHKNALELLGYKAKPKFSLSKVKLASEVLVGNALVWRGVLTSPDAQKLKIALRVHFLKSNGSHSAKVFAVKDVMLEKNEKLHIEKSISFKPITTRALHLGLHHIELLVNGTPRGKKSFELMA